MTDLDELKRLYAKATADGSHCLDGYDFMFAIGEYFPALIKELEALRELEKAADAVDTDWNPESAKALRAALLSVERAREGNVKGKRK